MLSNWLNRKKCLFINTTDISTRLLRADLKDSVGIIYSGNMKKHNHSVCMNFEGLYLLVQIKPDFKRIIDILGVQIILNQIFQSWIHQEDAAKLNVQLQPNGDVCRLHSH